MDRTLTKEVKSVEAPREMRGGIWRRTTRAKGPKQPERGQRMIGEVLSIQYGRSYGFIRTEHSRHVFFHRSDVAHRRFNTLTCGVRVEFELIEDKLVGPRAVRVRFHDAS